MEYPFNLKQTGAVNELTPEQSARKFLKKMYINSFYYPLGNKEFVFYDPEIAKQTSETGRKIIKELQENVIPELERKFPGIKFEIEE